MLHESIYWYQLIEYKVFFKFAFEFHNFIFEKRNLNSLPVEGLFNNMKMVINLLLYLCNNHQILRHENVRYVYVPYNHNSTTGILIANLGDGNE